MKKSRKRSGRSIKRTRRNKKIYKGGCKKFTTFYDWIISVIKELNEK